MVVFNSIGLFKATYLHNTMSRSFVLATGKGGLLGDLPLCF